VTVQTRKLLTVEYRRPEAEGDRMTRRPFFVPIASLAAANWYLRELLDCRTLTVAEQPAAYVELWERTDPDLRIARTRAWLWTNRDRGELATFVSDLTAFALADLGEARHHALWSPFASSEVGRLLRSFGGIDFATVHARHRPHEVAPGVDLVVFDDDSRDPGVGTQRVFGDASVAQWLIRHRREGWLLASFSSRLPDSGWPEGLFVPAG
jgi:hypothetical protein